MNVLILNTLRQTKDFSNKQRFFQKLCNPIHVKVSNSSTNKKAHENLFSFDYHD